MSKTNVILDCDPGIDDSVAIFLLTRSDAVDIKLITTVAGNKDIENITNNTLHILEKLNVKIPVAKGAAKPIKANNNFPDAHGAFTGLGNYQYSELHTSPIELDAVEAMYDVLIANRKEKTTILSIGPLTNVANLLTRHPDCKKYIERIIFMGGQKDDTGLQQPYEEFNASYDPEATRIVVESKLKLTMVPMDLGHMAYLTSQEILDSHFTSEIGDMFFKMFLGYVDGHTPENTAATHDPCATLVLTHPDYVKKEKCHISIEYDTNKKFYYIKCDFKRRPNAEICMDIDINKFKEIFFNALLNS